MAAFRIMRECDTLSIPFLFFIEFKTTRRRRMNSEQCAVGRDFFCCRAEFRKSEQMNL